MRSLQFYILIATCAVVVGACARQTDSALPPEDHGDAAPEQQEVEPADNNASSVTEADYKHFGSLRLGNSVLEGVRQNSGERTYEDAPTKLLLTIGQSAETAKDSNQVLLSLTDLRLHPDGSRLYVFDSGRKQIRSFRLADGKFDRAYGRKGSKDGEYILVADFDVAADGSVWVFDGGMRRVTIFEDDGTVRRTNAFTMSAHSLALMPGDGGPSQRYVILSGLHRPQVLHTFDADGNETASFGAFAPKPIMNLGLLGRLMRTSRGFVWVPWYAGRIAGFQSNGELDFFRSTFYPTEPRRLGKAGSAETLQPIEGPVASRSPVVTQTSDGIIFVAVYQRESDVVPIDAYDLETGDYRYTLTNPDEPGCYVLGVTDASIFTACPVRGVINQWQRLER